jgi:hypothetical protein
MRYLAGWVMTKRKEVDSQAKSGRREILTPAPHTSGHTGLPSAVRE